MTVSAAHAVADTQDGARTPGAALCDDGSCEFTVWAPGVQELAVHVIHPVDRVFEMERDERDWFSATVLGLGAGARYLLRINDDVERPDPASRFQPEGVHGPSEVFRASFPWKCATWRRPDLHELVLYEIHVGTFTPEGTFDAVIPRLPLLRELGITCIEIMPVAQFPGARNWGYDGVYPYATQNTYGGPDGMKRLVDAAHEAGLWVVLDVVYNHIGPEGNYLPEFGPYFTDTYHTPWGRALNFDGAGSDEVRRFFIANALQWVDEFHFDGLRLDAVHAIHDRSALPFLRELTTAVHERAAALGRTALVIAESDLGDPRVLRSPRLGGHGMDAQWLDDFHHALHTLLTGECGGYYADFGAASHLATAYRNGFVYTGQHSPFRQRRHGAPAPDIAPRQLIVYAQNHDQIGNRLAGDRLTTLLEPDQVRLAAAATLLSPFTPLLFMGEEYGERSPFPYFVSHSDSELIDAVLRGRREEFDAFAWQQEPPDPHSVRTFESAILDWDARATGDHARLLALYRHLLDLRRKCVIWRGDEHTDVDIVDTAGRPAFEDEDASVLIVRRASMCGGSALVLNFTGARARLPLNASFPFRCAVDTAAEEWGGPGSLIPAGPIPGGTPIVVQPHSAVLLIETEPSE